MMFTIYKLQEPLVVKSYRVRDTAAKKLIMPSRRKKPLEVKQGKYLREPKTQFKIINKR